MVVWAVGCDVHVAQMVPLDRNVGLYHKWGSGAWPSIGHTFLIKETLFDYNWLKLRDVKT